MLLDLRGICETQPSACSHSLRLLVSGAGVPFRYPLHHVLQHGYSIVFDSEDLTQFFTDVSITQENGIPYLNALFKGHRTVCERILPLDAERYQKGELPLSNMLHKYCSYLMARDQKKANLFR